MKRLSALMIGVLMVSAPMFTSGSSAGASMATPHVVTGTYNLYDNWNNGGWNLETSFTLYSNHTGIDGYSDPITWSASGKTITLKINSVILGATVTAVGTKNRVGISKKRNPGTITNSLGPSGVWYAVKTS